MYQHSYAEVLEDDQTLARQAEYQALDRAVALLTRAAACAKSNQGVEALYYTRKLWTTLLTELVAQENALSNELKAKLISIGIWVLREADAIRLDKSTNYAGIADICAIVRDGLR